MDLRTYRSKHGISQAGMARKLTAAGHPCTQALVSQWERGQTVMTAEWCVRIEQITKGESKRVCNRPDLFGPIKKAA